MFRIEKFLEKYPPSKDCVIRRKMKILGDKWFVLTLFILEARGTMRFNELHREMENIDGVSPKVLSDVLKNLEKENIIAREVYPSVPPKVEYSLTERGLKLIPILHQMMKWIDEQNG